MSVYENKFIGKLTDDDVYYIEKWVDSGKCYSFISRMVSEQSENKDILDIIPGSKLDGILLVEAALETSKNYNVASRLSKHVC